MAREKWEPRKSVASLGSWNKHAFEKAIEHKGSRYSSYDLLIRQEYKRALRGDVAAVKIMLTALDANIAAREKLYPEMGYIVREGQLWDPQYEEPRNADLALLILGIASIREYRFSHISDPADPACDDELKRLVPNQVEPWVIDCVRERDGEVRRDPERNWRNREADKSVDSPQWRQTHKALLAGLMRVRGPGASKFKPGECGNPKGRPRKAHTELPHEEFFIETVTFFVNGKKQTMTRLDALMTKMVEMAKTNEKIARLILPRLMKLEQLGWNERWEDAQPAPIIRG